MPQPECLPVPQDRETPVQLVRGPAFTYRYAYARSADTRTAGDPGQDYLVVRHDDQAFTFALCDGVSQSFYGNLAARSLGDALVGWLWDGLPAALDAQVIRVALAAHLSTLTESVTEQVQRQSLPDDIPPMLRDVLEQKRAQGSESTFVCGRIDLPGSQFPPGRVVLAWMGDSRLRLWGPDGERSADLGGEFKMEQRWSSRRGLVGDGPHLFVSPLEQDSRCFIQRLAAYSDGLSTLDQHSHPLSNFALQDLITQASEAATSDDITVLEVWLGSAPTQVEARPLLVPQSLEVGIKEDRLRAAWRPVPGASRYQVQVRDSEVQTWDVSALSWESPSLEPGKYQVRVRAVQGGEPGEWSAVQEVEVPVPVPPAPPVTLVPAPPTAPVPPAEPAAPTATSPSAVPAPSLAPAAPQSAPPVAGLSATRPTSHPMPPPRPMPRHSKLLDLAAFVTGGAVMCCMLAFCSLLILPEKGPLHGVFLGPVSTPTPVAIPTPVPMVRPTLLPTATASPTAKRTLSPRPSHTSTLTATPSPSATTTPIRMPTPSPTATITPTTIPTPSRTVTPQPSPYP